MNDTNIPIVDRVAKRIDTLRTQQELSIRELAKRSVSLSQLYTIFYKEIKSQTFIHLLTFATHSTFPSQTFSTLMITSSYFEVKKQS